MVQNAELAKYIHIYSLVPVDDEVQAIPIGVYFHDGTSSSFSSGIVKKHWQTIITATIISGI